MNKTLYIHAKKRESWEMHAIPEGEHPTLVMAIWDYDTTKYGEYTCVATLEQDIHFPDNVDELYRDKKVVSLTEAINKEQADSSIRVANLQQQIDDLLCLEDKSTTFNDFDENIPS